MYRTSRNHIAEGGYLYSHSRQKPKTKALRRSSRSPRSFTSASKTALFLTTALIQSIQSAPSQPTFHPHNLPLQDPFCIKFAHKFKPCGWFLPSTFINRKFVPIYHHFHACQMSHIFSPVITLPAFS